MRAIIVICFLLGLGNQAFAQLKLARLFSNHAVLQRQKPLPVWGWATPNEAISVSLANQTLTTQANTEGEWRVTFSPLEAGGPYKLAVSSPNEKLLVEDILMGEVWLCSGQSNMEWTVAQADNFLKERKNADFPQIRHFKVEHEVSLQPEKDLKTGEWKLCKPETVGGFTAIGFFFAREIHQKLSKAGTSESIPIGILHSSWGGSQVEGWISKEAMLGSNERTLY